MPKIPFKFIPKAFLLILFILLTIWKNGYCDTSQAWLKNSITFTLSSRLGLQISHETRNLDITYFNPYYKNVAGGFVFHLPKNFYISAVYKRVHVEIKDIVYNENRFVLEAGWKTKMAEKLGFDIRFRTEIREFDEEYPEDHLRYRLQLRLKTELDVGKHKLEPFIANEILGKSKIYSVQKNRLYIGTMIPMSEHVTFVISYMWLAIKGDESIHILYSGFKLRF